MVTSGPDPNVWPGPSDRPSDQPKYHRENALHEVDANANVIGDLKKIILPEEVIATKPRSLFSLPFRRKAS